MTGSGTTLGGLRTCGGEAATERPEHKHHSNSPVLAFPSFSVVAHRANRGASVAQLRALRVSCGDCPVLSVPSDNLSSMDPVSHVAFGRTLVALDSRRALGPGAIAACVLGSLAPDLDAVFMPIGWDIYLRRHQGGTHSLIGAIVCAALTAALVRLQSKHGRYRSLLLAAWAGAMGHLLLDVMSGADVRFFWPIGPAVAVPLFAMADPWLGGVLALGLLALIVRKNNSARMAAAILISVTALGGVKAALYARAQSLHDTSDRFVQFRRAEAEWGFTDSMDHVRNESRRSRLPSRERHDRHRHAAAARPRGWTIPLLYGPGSWKRCRTFLRRTASRSLLWLARRDRRFCGRIFDTVVRRKPFRALGADNTRGVHPSPAPFGLGVNSIPRRVSPPRRLSMLAISSSAGRSADRTPHTRRLAKGVPSPIGLTATCRPCCVSSDVHSCALLK